MALSHFLEFSILEKRIIKLFNLDRKGAASILQEDVELNRLTVAVLGTELPFIIFLT